MRLQLVGGPGCGMEYVRQDQPDFLLVDCVECYHWENWHFCKGSRVLKARAVYALRESMRGLVLRFYDFRGYQ